MRRKRHSPGKILGTATELLAGRSQTQTWFGTYADDLPYPRFRLRVAVVEHADAFGMHSHEY